MIQSQMKMELHDPGKEKKMLTKWNIVANKGNKDIFN